jgi:uncharacterized protein (TIGR02145 family)
MSGKTGPSQFTEPNIVTIGTQTWTKSNLQTTTYRNGDPIPEVQDATTWDNLTTGAWCYYNHDAAIGAVYGKLYNIYAIQDPRGLAPQGWHVATYADWDTLKTYVGSNSGLIKEAGTSHWNTPNTGATNSTGFTLLPGGYRSSGNVFVYLGNYVVHKISNAGFNTGFRFDYNTTTFNYFGYNALTGVGVRCIKD